MGRTGQAKGTSQYGSCKARLEACTGTDLRGRTGTVMRKRERAVRLHPSEEPTVVLRSPVVQEALPSPWVHYPNHYGTFMAFGEDDHEFPALCNCATGAVANYLALRKLVDMGTYADERITAPLSSHTFPNRLAEESLRRKADPMAWLRFEPRLCHRCNLATPTLRWCLEMYLNPPREGVWLAS